MRDHDVSVIFTQLPFRQQILDASQRGYAANVALGAFLRTEIPMISNDSGVVLYTDCDVLFLKDPVYNGLPIKYFAAGPEMDVDDYSVHGMNTGVMYMNLPVLRLCQESFRQYITDNLETFCAFDQGAYRNYFHSLWQKLDPRFNWKPYWGFNDDAYIIHFHGPKYETIKGFQAGGRSWYRYESMCYSNVDDYAKYALLFESFLHNL